MAPGVGGAGRRWRSWGSDHLIEEQLQWFAKEVLQSRPRRERNDFVVRILKGSDCSGSRMRSFGSRLTGGDSNGMQALGRGDVQGATSGSGRPEAPKPFAQT